MTRWMPIAALAAFACVLSACGVSAPDPTVSGPAKTSPSTTTPPPTVSTTTSTTLPTAVAPVNYRWTRLRSPALDAGGGASSTLSAVLAPNQTSNEWLLAGTRIATGGATDATVWTSPDALRWTATALRGGADGQARAATEWGERTVVVGSVGSGLAQHAAVWISPNPDSSFRPVPRSASFGVPAGTPADLSAGSAEPTGGSESFATSAPAGAAMDSVTAGALGVFASGTVAGQLAMWFSTNGTIWERLPKAESVIESSPGAVVRQVLETPGGIFAVGSILHDGTTDAAMWSSGDGINWRLVSNASSFTGPGDQVLSSISTFGQNLVVAGGIRFGASWVPASWISPNLSAWGAPSEAFSEPTGRRLDLTGSVVADMNVSADGSTLAAVGGSASEQRLWLSKDGINWTPVPLPQAAADDADWTAGEVATTGTTTVVVDPNPGQPRLLVDGVDGWHEVSADPAVFGSPQTVETPTHLVDQEGRLVMTVDVKQPGQSLGSDQDSTEILTSTNGGRWTVAPTGDTFLGQTVSDLAVTDRGLVAVGGASATTAAVTSAASPGEPTLTVWRSTDAKTWTAVRLDARGAVDGSALPSNTTRSTGTSTTTPARTTTPGKTATTTPDTTTPASATTQAPRPTVPTTRPLAARAPTTIASPTTSAPPSGSTTTPLAPSPPPPSPYQVPEGAVTSLGKTLYVATSFSGHSAIGWKSSNGTKWTPLGTLDSEPVAEPDTVSGACSIPEAAVAVGATASGQGGSTGSAWQLSPPAGSTAVGPIPPADSAEYLLGCSDTSTGSLIGWGASASSNGAPTAALWSSSTGNGWNRRTVAAFLTTNGTPAITDVADDGNTWLAVTGSSTEPWTEDGLSALGVWESADAGQTWRQLPTSPGTWGADFGVSASQVVYLGLDPIVAGQVDGRLAVWQGTPTA
ncbi:MAG: hypothetical protein FWC87_02175 [Acidimicrobiaceae bacterium]|nr:hypothetical protein [Acidimicrobiaceae bacterium]